MKSNLSNALFKKEIKATILIIFVSGYRAPKNQSRLVVFFSPPAVPLAKPRLTSGLKRGAVFYPGFHCNISFIQSNRANH